jgi:ParB/RepB/Spo0J family partition protein
MELEFHQLDRRYEQLRASCPKREGRVLASLDRDGQQLPAVVVAGGEAGRFILVDGYKRVRALLKLKRDTVRVTCWALPESEALLLERLMRTAEGDSALEQGWLLSMLRERFDLTVEQLARRFGRSLSWVSGRLGLVRELPASIQEHVRRGRLVPHAAMKHLLPLARANRKGAIALADAIAPLSPSTRQTEALCVAFARGNDEARAYLLRYPVRFLRAREVSDKEVLPISSGEQLLRDLGALGGIARRACTRVRAGAVRELLPPEQEELRRRAGTAQVDVARLWAALDKESKDAGRAYAADHSRSS